ncbi:FAD-dependent monooxygenase [Microlunatus speluncae]|uniref:FAD-dependent monooxygenase n=1 Tax=Microlunatus speluncae TaxID=2594267 RepID=UPI001C2DC862|nr:FAD-dependent monooxygenase [Microlunatus speluncae]
MEAFVAGGGIAGLAAAVALLRAGWRVTVAERQPVLAEIGAGLAISRNGLAALTWLGLADAVRAAGHPVAITGQQDHRGRWLMRQPADDPRFAATNRVVGVHRARLLSLLEQEVRRDPDRAAVLLGSTVIDVAPGDPDGARATVHWADAAGERQQAEADLVVIADGVGSKVRDRLLPGVEIAYSGKTCWRAVINDAGATGSGLVGDEFVQLWGPHTEFGAVRIGAGEVYWYGYFVAPAQTRFDDELAAAQTHFAGWSPGVREIIAATEAGRLLRHDVIHLPGGAPSYRVGRAVLAGDAAHALVPTMGQGANLSLEDGAGVGALIGVPVAAGGSLAAAIAAYDEVRRPRGRLIARRSLQTGRLGADLGRGLPQFLRNAVLRLIPTRLVVEAGARVLDWSPDQT